MRITESQLRRVVREEILKEWTPEQALMYSPETTLDAIIGIIKDIFRPSNEKRLVRAGDDKILNRLSRELNMIHTQPEYRVAWQGYKALQRQHRSMEGSPSIKKSLERIRSRMYESMDSAEASLSRENEEIWGSTMKSLRIRVDKLWKSFDDGKITAGGLLRMIDPTGVVESKRR